MEKVKNIELYYLTNSLHQSFMSTVQQHIEKCSAEKLNIVAAYAKFAASLEALDAAKRGSRGSAITHELLALDRQRLKTYSAIRGRLKNTMSCPIPEEKEAAKDLHHALMQKGDIPKENYIGKSAKLRFLCEKLLDEQHLPLCKKIGITHWVEALRDENNTFEDKRHERSYKDAHRYAGKVKDARARIDLVYKEIVSRINASVELQLATPEMEDFIMLTNKKIKRLKSLRAWQRSMRAGKKRREAEKREKNKSDTESQQQEP